MAAISLARRVADELGSPLGKASPAAKVGYSVRFDDNVGRGNRIKYLTEGMLLQEILRDPGLCDYGVVVVDEVHERSVNVDLILGMLRELLVGRGKGAKRRKNKAVGELRVVVMSATADVEALKSFFEEGFEGLSDHYAGSNQATFTVVEGDDARSEESWSGFSSSDDDVKEKRANGMTTLTNGKMNGKALTNGDSRTYRISTCFVQGRQFPVQDIYLPQPIQDFSEAALKCVFQVHCKEPMPGDILVFLTGQDTVQTLQRSIEEYAQSLTNAYPKVSPWIRYQIPTFTD